MKHRSTTARGKRGRRVAAVAAILGAAAIAAAVTLYNKSADPSGPLPVNLPATPQSYLGIFSPGFPASDAGLASFGRATGAKPDVAMYYSGWYVPFPSKFAQSVAARGAVPLVQMDPNGASLAAIASGHFDPYLSQYAEAVRTYRHPVILSFGHEMNGTWYPWGYRHASPAQFVAAWRHVVRVFRVLGANNVTWLWTVNVIDDTVSGRIPAPAPWWPGRSYVNWVGIDGYYLKQSWAFAPLFGPTISAVRALTTDPILIAETGAVPASGQAGKIANLFTGVREYGLLGFVWFNDKNSAHQNFSIDGPAALAAFRKGARAYSRP